MLSVVQLDAVRELRAFSDAIRYHRLRDLGFGTH